MNSSQVFCANCDALISAENINIKAMAAKCSSCDHVFNLASPSLSKQLDEGFSKDDLGNAAPARPKSITTETGFGGDLHLKRSWFSPMLFVMLIFCCVWDSFLFFWYSVAFTQPNTPWIMVVFPIGHVAAGVVLTYTVIAGFLNKTYIIADHLSISVKHQPVPWLGSKEIYAKDIRQLTIESDAYGNQYGHNRRAMERFKIMADVNGEETKVLGGLGQSEARYIAFEIGKKIKVDIG